MKLAIYAAVFIGLALVALHFWRAGQFGAYIEGLNQKVAASQSDVGTAVGPLPAIVRAFALRNGGTVGGPAVVLAEQSAEMRLDPEQPFFNLKAIQVSGTRNPAFVWHASGHMMSIVPVEIIDAFVDGAGLLEARIAGSVTVAQASGPGSAKGEAMRFLAELPFNPDAILNAPDLVWTVAGPDAVDVSLSTSDGLATVRLAFNADGDVEAISAADRPRLVGEDVVPTKWVGRFADYAKVGDYRLPLRGEIAWILPQGEFIYWRGGMTALRPF